MRSFFIYRILRLITLGLLSSPFQNQSLTYMALTARAIDYAVKKLKKGNI